MNILVPTIATLMLMPLTIGAFIHARQTSEATAALMLVFCVIVLCGIWQSR